MSQKAVPTSDQQQSRKTRQNPAIPPSRAKPRPTQTQRSRPSKPGQNRARNTSPSAALMHQPTLLDSGSADPKTQASQSPGQDKGTRNSTKVSRSTTDQTPADLSMDTRHIKVPHKAWFPYNHNDTCGSGGRIPCRLRLWYLRLVPGTAGRVNLVCGTAGTVQSGKSNVTESLLQWSSSQFAFRMVARKQETNNFCQFFLLLAYRRLNQRRK